MKPNAYRIAFLVFSFTCSFWNTYAYSQDAGPTSSQYRSPTQIYIDNTKGKPPKVNLNRALRIFAKEFSEKKARRRLVAADLGAGAGNETISLIKKGWHVIAIDIDSYAVKTIHERFEGLPKGNASGATPEGGSLDARLISLQKMRLEPDSIDLINASLVLPFVPRGEMKAVWNKIVKALRVGGVFTGHFFGPEHAWSNRPSMSFYSVKEIFREFVNDYPLEVRSLFNKKGEIRSGTGSTAFFHTIAIIAQKVNE